MSRRYRHTRRAGRTVDVHRLVWEDAHGPIPAGHVVHHTNGDKLDNRLANLELMTHAEHSAHHNNKHPRTRLCDVCGRSYAPHPTKRGRSKTCGKPCARVLMSRAAISREESRRAAREALLASAEGEVAA